MFSKGYSTILFMLVFMIAAYTVSCTGDLNTSPIDARVTTSADVYDTPEDFRQVLAKLYAGYATTGQQGPAGNADIQGIDEGFSQYIRQYWVHQVLPTDEAVVGWNDPGLPEFNFQTWTPSNDFVMGMYSRIFYQVTLTNEFIRQAQPRTEPEIQGFKAEARFLRAMTYWHALDFYGGNVPFVTENDPIGAFLPQQTNAQDLFEYIESELLAILDDLPAPQQNEYGRADRAAAWMVLAKLYLNAEVYIGEDRYADALDFASRIIEQGGYQLADNYEHLFMADNDRPEIQQSIIFPIRFDGTNIRTFGGTTFIIHAGVGGEMSAGDFGIGGGWAGHRVTPQFVDFFENNRTYNGFETPNTNGAPELYVIGDFQQASGYGNNFDPDTAPPLVGEEIDEELTIFRGQVYFADDNGEFQISSDRDGSTIFGGSNRNLIENGDNISINRAGLYEIEVSVEHELDEDDNIVSTTRGYIFNRYVNFEDSRAMFFNFSKTKDISSLSNFNNGYSSTKWRNITSTGISGSNSSYADTDFPMFRLADAHLIYAEAHLRGGGGSAGQALDLVNAIRERAHGDNSFNITAGELTLDFILDERARELYWEGHRRTDLIRYGLFTSADYVWTWKGNEQNGVQTDPRNVLYPLPSSDVNANPNLEQNDGYN